MGLAVGEDLDAAAVEQVVPVLHRGYGRHGPGPAQLAWIGSGEPDPPDQPLVTQLDQGAEGILQGYLAGRGLTVTAQAEVGQFAGLDAQVGQGFAHLAAQRLGPVVGEQGAIRAAVGAHLVPDDQPGGVGVQGRGDEPVDRAGAVGVGRVEEVHAEGDRLAQNRDRVAGVCGQAPDAGAGQLHRAVTDPVDRGAGVETVRRNIACRLSALCACHVADASGQSGSRLHGQHPTALSASRNRECPLAVKKPIRKTRTKVRSVLKPLIPNGLGSCGCFRLAALNG